MTQSHTEETAIWRAQMEDSLRAPDGWLSLTGLFWLAEGDNTVGSEESSTVLLPPHAPSRVGVVSLHGDEAHFSAAEDIPVRINEQPVHSAPLHSDTDPSPDTLALGPLRIQLIQRGERMGMRVRDATSPRRESFGGREWYPIAEEFRVEARFEQHEQPRHIAIVSILGDVEQQTSPGAVVFNLGGQETRLDALPSQGSGLFLLFKDGTNGHGTYPAGRFLRTPPPQNGRVVLDFNRAYSPPCAFSPFATCPLPPRQNYLPFAIPAGERYTDAEHD